MALCLSASKTMPDMHFETPGTDRQAMLAALLLQALSCSTQSQGGGSLSGSQCDGFVVSQVFKRRARLGSRLEGLKRKNIAAKK